MPDTWSFDVARPADTQCVDSHCPGSTQAPTFALIALLVVAVLLIVLAVRLWRPARRQADRVLSATAAILAGIATMCLVLFGSGLRHYGGPGNADGSACSAWWQEAGLPAAAQGVESDIGAVDCRHHAVDAIGPALGEGGVGGVLVGAAVFALSGVRRRTTPRRTGYVYSDHAGDVDRPER